MFGIIGLLTFLGAPFSIAYAIDRSESTLPRFFFYAACLTLLFVTGAIGLLLAFSSALMDPQALTAEMGDAGLGLLQGLPEAITTIGWWMAGLSLVGMLILPKPVRVLLSRLMPLDASRITHALALQYVLLLVLISAVNAIFIGMIPCDGTADAEINELLGSGVNLTSLWGQAIGFVLLSFLGVGLFVSRNRAETFKRLGLTRRFSWKYWLVMTALGLLASVLTDQLWQAYSPESLECVERTSGALFGPILKTGMAGALTIGLSAGIGEEILFRGALQPRFGIFATSLMFAAIHTQYSISPALIQILVIALLLGITRKQVNTVTAIAVHSTYNFILAIIGMCGSEEEVSCPIEPVVQMSATTLGQAGLSAAALLIFLLIVWRWRAGNSRGLEATKTVEAIDPFGLVGEAPDKDAGSPDLGLESSEDEDGGLADAGDPGDPNDPVDGAG